MAGRPEPPPSEEPTWALYDDPAPARRRTGVLLGGALALLLAAGATWSLAARDPEPPGTTSRTVTEVDSASSADVQRFTTAGIARLVAALRAETGSPRVLEAILFPTTAVLVVPVDAGAPQRYEWDGERLHHAGPGASFRRPFDLGAVDGDLLGRLCGDPTQACTVIAGRPLAGQDRAWLTVTGADGVRRTDLRGEAV